MKIGIVTIHDGVNHGSFLQVYALQEFLKSKGFQVDVINFRTKKLQRLERNYFLTINDKKSIQSYRYYFLTLLKFRKSRNELKLLNLTKRTRYINNSTIQDYKYIIYGSDEIWNIENPFAENGCFEYFGVGVTKAKKISYAPSFGSLQGNYILDNTRKQSLKEFKSLSVRDNNSKKILENINLTSLVVLDPTFLFDLKDKAIQPKFSGYILIYVNRLSEKSWNKLREFAEIQNKTLISISNYSDYSDHNIISINSFEWLGFFLHADFVITNTFHGAVFSILFQKKFACLEVTRKLNKISDLLNRFKISNRLHKEFNKDVEEILTLELDTDVVFNLLYKQIHESQSFILKSLT